MVFLSFSGAVMGSRPVSADRTGHALSLNAVARWAYVGLYYVSNMDEL